MSNESDFMLGIAAAVADGAAVNWDQAEAQLTTDDDKRVLRSLRLVSEIGSVHDSVGGEADTTRTGQPAGETLPAAGASTDLTAEHEGDTNCASNSAPALRAPSTERGIRSSNARWRSRSCSRGWPPRTA
jgi:hypothetical protein